MEPARRCRLPLLCLCLCLCLLVLLGSVRPGDASPARSRTQRVQQQAPTRAPAPTPAPTRVTGDSRVVIDAPQRCPDGQAAYHNNCRTLRGPG